MRPFLPMTLDETGGEPLDIVLVTGDAYVDHPSWGVAAIGRWLQDHGFTVGVIAQPDWTDVEAFRALGRPRLFFGVTAGNMDTQVNKFTASRRLRSKDAYTPGGEVGRRPDRATIPYTSRCKQAYKGVPVIAGGVEASLRRFAHYDFWQDKVRGSILLEAKADLLVYGMGERQVLDIANTLRDGGSIRDCRALPGVAFPLGAKDPVPSGPDVVEMPALSEVKTDGDAFNRATMLMYRESNPHCGKTLIQQHGTRWVVQNPPAQPLSTPELDRVHSQGLGQAVDLLLVGHGGLGGSEAAHGHGDGVIGVDSVAVYFGVGDTIGAGHKGDGVIEHRDARGGVGAGVGDALDLDGDDLSLAGGSPLVAEVEGMAFAGVAERLLAGEDDLDRPAEDKGAESQEVLDVHILPPAKGPADGRNDLAHLVQGQLEEVGDLVQVVVGPLGGGDHRHPPLLVNVAHPGLRLQVGVLDHRGRVDILDDDIGAGEAGLHIALAHPDVVEDVRLPVLVHQGAALLHGLAGVGHNR